MRLLPCLLVAVLGACSSADKNPYQAAQTVLDEVAGQHADLARLTLHATPMGKSDLVQIASTMAERRGKPSDPEDLEAMRTGKEVVRDEPEAVDVTVPILPGADGKATAVAGVTLHTSESMSKDDLVKQAHAIAEELAAAVQAAGKSLW